MTTVKTSSNLLTITLGHQRLHPNRYLQQKDIDAPLAGFSYRLPDTFPAEGIFVVDTTDLFAALEGDGEQGRRSLDRICKHLKVQTEYLHNAGNDAHVRVHLSS
jgi:hypothetical protein